MKVAEGIRVLDGELIRRGDAVVIRPAVPEQMEGCERVWIERRAGALVYRYAEPRRVSANEFVVPSWFDPQMLEGLSVARFARPCPADVAALLQTLVLSLATDLAAQRREAARLREIADTCRGTGAILRGIRDVLGLRKRAARKPEDAR